MLMKTMSEVNVKLGLKAVLARIEETCKRRAPELQGNIPLLVAVSKTKPVEMIIEAYEAGQRHFGENYAQELIEKANHKDILERCKDIKWHFIGNLQMNKINKLLSVTNLHMIETIYEEKVAAKVNTNWPKYGSPDTKLKVMIQVNTSGEEAKSGISPENVIELAKFVNAECPNLHLHGLMTIGRFGHDLSQGPNPDFILLKRCKDDVCNELNIGINNLHLSMGMSDDFEHAIELGSTNVRVGSTIFGSREKNMYSR